ncbi:zinc metalloproteinase nas-13-like [Strongylocentrotus purpuratus]|uniref:Metalloendopeptidase n=1 Tax=Strongylocentrotus purpuratus TaxID=7668 RepID=A0A7M7SYJ2_STRPU|nr:zinc metalloproteinase nas-13-like [Strongylocentrotus purpuratus]
MELSVIFVCMGVLLMGTANAEYNYKTGFLNAQGVPDGGMDVVPPSFEEIQAFGTANSGDAFTNIMARNIAINETELCLEQGDIPVPCNSTGRAKRNALRDRGMRWVNGVVPYVIDNRYDYGTRARITRAMERYHETTCIRFVERTRETDYIYIFPGNGCYSLVGRVGGQQQVSLGNGCTTNLGTIIHELMHAVGFHHEQTRTDRDTYVYIYFNNIIQGLEYNFDKYEQTYIDHLGTPYDLFSVMHYHMTAFTSNGQPTIVARDQRFQLDYRSDFSDNDINKLNIYYECDGNTVDPTLPEEVDCVDSNQNCPGWADAGYCATNSWMIANCKLSCAVCVITPTPTPGTGGNDDCKDMNDNCAGWANAGECQANPSWMLPNCPVSCDQCETVNPGENCIDMNENCAIWAKYRQCTENPGYMLEFCPRSCGQCVGSGIMQTCEDFNDQCADWASTEQCQLNPGYMNYECRKSCSLCAASSPLELLPQTQCQDTSGYCPVYAEDGMCVSKPEYMGLVCPDTCQMCPGKIYAESGSSGSSELRSFYGFLGALFISFLARRLAL